MSQKNLNEQEYLSLFNKVNSNGELKEIIALERAWKNRDFEIDKYWSRAAYFWAFIAATFAGFIAITSSEKLPPNFKHEFLFMIACLGIIFSLAWYLGFADELGNAHPLITLSKIAESKVQG